MKSNDKETDNESWEDVYASCGVSTVLEDEVLAEA